MATPSLQPHRLERAERRRRLADRRQRFQRFDLRQRVDLALQRGDVAAAERFAPQCAVARRRAGDQRRSRGEALLLEQEVQRLGLRAHQPGIAAGERMDDRVRRRAPGLVEIDQRAVLVEQHADNR